MSELTAQIKQFCTANEVNIEELIDTNKRGGIIAELRKLLTRKLVDRGHSFKQLAEIFRCRPQMVKYYYYSPLIENRQMEMEKLERLVPVYKEKIEQLTEWMSANAHREEFLTVVSDRNYWQGKLSNIKTKLENLRHGRPALGQPDPETKWNGYKNGNPIY